MARVKSVFIFQFILLASITAQNTSPNDADSVNLWTERYLSADNDTSRLYRSILRTVPSDQTMKKRTILVKALKRLSIFHESEGRLDSAIYFLNAVVNIQNEYDQEAQAETYLDLKTLHGNKADYLAAQEQVFAALEIYEQLGDQKGLALCYTHLCDLLYYEDKYRESIDYCDRAINIQQSLKEKIDLAISYRYKASSQLFADTPLDSALNNINRAIDIYGELGENGIPLLASINGRGNILKYMERYAMALADYREVYRRSQEMGLERYTIPALGNIGHIYTLEKKYSEALPYLLEAIEKIKESGNKNNLWENYMHVSDAYEAMADYEQALNYHKLFLDEYENYLYTIIDRLENEKQVKYEVQKKDELITEQGDKIATQRKIQILYLCLGLLLVSSLVGMYLSRNKIRRKQLEIERSRQELEKSLEELKATQSQLIHSEKMASLGELTAGIAHEIQNPLNFVNNFSEVNAELLEELTEDIKNGNTKEIGALLNVLRENENKIKHHGKRADGIVKSMLQHSRTSSGKKELTDINALCDEYLRLAYHGFRAKEPSFNCEINLHLDPELPRIKIVPQDIGRVLINLINNAFQATSAEASVKAGTDYKPEVIVATRRVDSPADFPGQNEMKAGAEDNAGVIEITISDNGPGIPDNLKDKIFQPFFTTKAAGQGTGLGLSLSYDIVNKGHGGELRVKPGKREGTTFIVELPIEKS